MRFLPSLLSLLSLSACSSSWKPADLDGDGASLADGDCWDDPSQTPEAFRAAEGAFQLTADQVNPSADETWYDGIDQDCAGDDDFDRDGDGYASAAQGVGDDCFDAEEDDFESAGLPPEQVHPGAEEVWYDGADQDCAGDDDFDQDGDGYASATFGDGDDCYDATTDDFENGAGLDPDGVNPGVDETWYDGTDADCAGDDDFDQDADGWERDDECDDTNPSRYPDPSVEETWYNGVDENCDGNDGDQDGDGHWASDYPFELPDGAVADDCFDDPTDPDWVPLAGFETPDPADVYPGADEVFYDGLDEDCAGDGDFDQDGDGHASATAPDGTGAVGDDCDDTLANVYPGAADDWYDGLDADCAGNDDFDKDADGSDSSVDCDEDDPTINPDAIETCGNTVDEDCTGSDNDEGASGCVTFYADSDGDAYGGSTAACLCEAEGAYTAASAEDCDDGDASVNPAGTETCVTPGDDDCDGETNAVGADGCTPWYADGDSDGYGSGAASCQCEADDAFPTADATDCDDTDDGVNPVAAEVCNGTDENCDGSVDEGLPLSYADADGDSYGAGAGDCGLTGGVDNADDCDDTRAYVYPGAAEICDGVANDCDTASGWTTANEDQKVSKVSAAGVYTDISSSINGSVTTTLSLDSGYTYYFCAGTYDTHISGSSDTADVVGIYGATDTVIESTFATGPVVSVTNGSVTISGMTLSGGHGSGTTTTYGGGVLGNYTVSPGPTAPHLVLEDCVVSGNDATRGGGVASYNYGWVKLVRTTVEDNDATDGGGIYMYSTSKVTLEDSYVQTNVASGDGGGIYLDDGVLTMTGSYVTDNAAAIGGGIYIDTGTATLTSSTVNENASTGDGGGVYLASGVLAATDSYLIDNDASDDAGALYVDTGQATCTGGGIYGNTKGTGASHHGGGVYLGNYWTTTSSFIAANCDFGTGATDNDPNDVEIKLTNSPSTYIDYDSYGSGASFTCTGASDICTP